ncbi:MAG: T9SS type A sorting domain-containing protein [Bacteroidetes bacterium]|nr:MAG: T9SS type A sorting domain-containing protein [Bacteroidota bacterium]
MKRTTLLLLGLFVFGYTSEAQMPRSFIRYHFNEETWDTISSLPVAELSDLQLPHQVGLLSQGEMDLPLDTPSTLNGTVKYSVKSPSAEWYNSSQFPHTTAVAIFQVVEGDTSILCSGSMIGPHHVLSAAHCYVSFTSDSLRFDSLLVAPQFNNGTIHPNFKWTRVVSAASPIEWYSDFSDITLLELDQPLGNLTGHLGLKSVENPEELENQFYYKLSYPSTYFPVADSTVYNGDTLYFSYGIIDSVGPHYMQIKGATGIPGESGSTFFNRDDGWYAYGVTSLLLDFKHTRLQPWHLYAIARILDNEPVNPLNKSSLVVFPNPSRSVIHIRTHSEINRVELYSITGQTVLSKEVENEVVSLDISPLRTGTYIAKVWTSEEILSARVVKLR